MKEIQNLHDEAMVWAEQAYLEKRKSTLEKAIELFLKAYALENSAAELAVQKNIPEPSKSVLIRSAASLAIECRKLAEAEKLICLGLAGDPPFELQNELRDLFEKVNFERHLELRGITLSSEEIQMSITGDSVDFGMAPLEKFLAKVTSVEKLIFRTAERQQGRPFRRGGKADKKITDSLEMFISVPRAASFAVTFKFGRPATQRNLPLEGLVNIQETIDELFHCLELFDRAQFNSLNEKFQEPAYFNNFIVLATTLAPDGKDIKQVGFTSIREGKKKSIAITREAEDPSIPEVFQEPTYLNEIVKKGKIDKVIGELKFADSTKGEGEIKLISESGEKFTIYVPEGMMDDIVRPMWGYKVCVEGYKYRSKVSLKKISKYEE